MIKKFEKNQNLAERLKKGEEDAYAYLIDTYNHKLCVYAKSLLNDVLLAEDIVQNVFIKLWEKRNNIKPELSLKNYLYKSVFNECINEFKRVQSLNTLERKYIEELDNLVGDKDEASLEKLITLVKEAIQELPPKCKEIFLLSKKEGLTNIEIAEYLNISKNTIEAQMTIAFSKIRKNVGSKTEIILFLLFEIKTSRKG